MLRPLRLLSYHKSLKVTVNCFIKSIKPLINITAFILVFFLIFAIFGIVIFKGSFYHCDGIDESIINSFVSTKCDCMDYGGSWINEILNFDNIGQALMTLYVISTTDGWTDLMTLGMNSVEIDYQPKENNSWGWCFYYISFLVLTNFMIMEFYVGIIVDEFSKEQQQLEGTFNMNIN